MSAIIEPPQASSISQSPSNHLRAHSNIPTPSKVDFAGMNVPQGAVGSFDGRSGSFTANGAPQQHMFNNAPNGQMATPASFRSFQEPNAYTAVSDQPQIYTAAYSGIQVYEMMVGDVAVMRRRNDSFLNATQILKVAGVEKGKRTKVLEKEILTGEHEKVQGGYGKYQGTWISYRRGREFCQQYGVLELLRPLLDYDVNADGSGGPGQGIETPTKEQAMAANRKRYYTASMDNRGGGPLASGTFFQNISSTASNALAVMNKVARMNSPAPRPNSSQRRPGTVGGRPSQPPMASQDSMRSSQQSMPSFHSEKSFTGANGPIDSTYGTGTIDQSETQEPPRKRMRSSQEEPFALQNAEDVMRDGTPTEPNESFMEVQQGDGEIPSALPPLPQPSDKITEEKQLLLTDLFADQTRTDFTNHPAINHLSGSDLDLPIDQAANTALHWAATLARVSLMRLLVAKGANMFRGNAAGQTPLMSAVQVNNSLDHSCFPETLEILAPLIEFRDHSGRTILHHIALTCAIKGRAGSSKYYLEALLEYLVRNNTSGNAQSGANDVHNSTLSGNRPIGLMRFMKEMVDVRDKAGNTALNLAARTGNRSIIRQLLEVQADVTIPNYKGMRPIEFGVGVDVENTGYGSMSQMGSPSKAKAPPSRVEETSREIMPLINSFLSQSDTQYNAESRIKQDQIDRTNSTIRELSTLQKSESAKLDILRSRARATTERQKKIQNLARWTDAQKRALASTEPAALMKAKSTKLGDADADSGVWIRREHLPDSAQVVVASLPSSTHPSFLDTPLEQLDVNALSSPQSSHLYSLPSLAVLRARLDAYISNNKSLADTGKVLKERNSELEMQYRRVIALCTNTREEEIDERLGGLVAAIESEVGEGVDVGRVRDFLKKVEGVDG